MIKDLEMRRSSWVIQVGPKFRDQCSRKKHTEETIDMDVKTEAEIGVMWLQANDAGSHQKLEEASNALVD